MKRITLQICPFDRTVLAYQRPQERRPRQFAHGALGGLPSGATIFAFRFRPHGQRPLGERTRRQVLFRNDVEGEVLIFSLLLRV